MDSSQASRVAFLSGAGMATIVMIHAKRTGKPREQTFKSLWAVGALTLGLAVAADFAPKVAGPFALLVLVAMAARNPGELGAVIGGAATNRSKAPAGPRGPGGLTAKSKPGAPPPVRHRNSTAPGPQGPSK